MNERGRASSYHFSLIGPFRYLWITALSVSSSKELSCDTNRLSVVLLAFALVKHILTERVEHQKMNSTIDSIPTWGTEYLDKQWKDGIDWQVSVKLVFAGLAGLFMLSSLFRNDVKVKAPFVGYRSFWEPTFILRFRFCQGAWPIVMEGYNKFKNNMFKVRRNDADILVISNKYVDELRALPDAKASAIHAHIKVG